MWVLGGAPKEARTAGGWRQQEAEQSLRGKLLHRQDLYRELTSQTFSGLLCTIIKQVPQSLGLGDKDSGALLKSQAQHADGSLPWKKVRPPGLCSTTLGQRNTISSCANRHALPGEVWALLGTGGEEGQGMRPNRMLAFLLQRLLLCFLFLNLEK